MKLLKFKISKICSNILFLFLQKIKAYNVIILFFLDILVKRIILLYFTSSSSSLKSSKCLLRHNEVKVIWCDCLAIASSSLEHIFKLFNTHSLSQLSSDSSQIVNSDCASLIVIKECEYSHDSLSSVFVSEFSCDCIKELFKVDASHVIFIIQIGNHFVNRWVFIFKS